MSAVHDLPTLYQQQIHRSKYARWRDEDNRREIWYESVKRYQDFMYDRAQQAGYTIPEAVREELLQAQLGLEVMGSMRALMTAGKALERDEVAGYNCSALAVDSPRAFDETMYILACGTGLGFSVEEQFISKLPDVPELHESETTVVVADSKIGWASALRQIIALLYGGHIPSWDVSKVRPAGARLKTFGGRASGPEPLEDLFRYAVATFKQAQGRKLTSLECHGIMCKIGEAIVVGGVRRSALISLSDPGDSRMRDAKAGEWYIEHPEYRLANNSAVWGDRPSVETFMEEWAALIRSKSGERGIVNRKGLQQRAARSGRRDATHDFLLNPCAEIALRNGGLCNLSEVVVRSGDSEADLHRKVRLATILGTIQSTLTNFRYLSAKWKRNAEEERLLGVSLTGIMDHPLMGGAQGTLVLERLLKELKQTAIDTNAEWAGYLGINPAAAITCVKPSGTVSQLVDCASGIHPRWSPYYIRTNRGAKRDPVSQFLYMQGVPAEDDVFNADDWVFSYPVKAPEGAITREQVSALDQLKLWMTYAEHWCEHNPSITVYVREEEWLEVGAFVYRNFEKMTGVSFLPHSDHVYTQAPYQEIDAETWQGFQHEMPDELDWMRLMDFESEDCTEGAQELACVAGACEVL